jgi:Ca2+-binding RTX toxin-like protein
VTNIENSTISGNDASNAGPGAAGSGGGLHVDAYSYYDTAPTPVLHQSGTVNVKNSTIAGNTAAAPAGGIFESANHGAGAPPIPPVVISSTIVGDNSPEDLRNDPGAPGFVAGHSLIESTAGAFALASAPAGSNIFKLDPQLGGLANNGGPTLTRLPAATSPVVDAGFGNTFSTDQRGPGSPRTLDGAVPNRAGSDGTDIGAVELPAQGACDGEAPTIIGTPGRDKIKGTPGPDVIRGLAGNDKIRGLAGNDVICGGSGNDTLRGGDGKDKLFGGAGSDRLIGGPGLDKLFAGTPGSKRSKKTNDRCSDAADQKHGC